MSVYVRVRHLMVSQVTSLRIKSMNASEGKDEHPLIAQSFPVSKKERKGSLEKMESKQRLNLM